MWRKSSSGNKTFLFSRNMNFVSTDVRTCFCPSGLLYFHAASWMKVLLVPPDEDLLLSHVLPVCKVSVVSLLPVSQNRARWTSAQRLLLQTVYFCWSFVPVWWHVCWLQVRQTNRRHVTLVYCPDPITQRPVRPTGSVRQSQERSEHVQSHRLLWKHPDSTRVCPVSAEKCGKLNARPQLCLRWTDVTLTDTCQPIREQVLSVWAAQEHHVQTSCHPVCSRPTAGTTLAAPGEW